jgi:hypothetical protein
MTLSVNPAWGAQALEGLIQKYKPGWTINIQIVADYHQMPRTPDGSPYGAIAGFRGQGYLDSEMAAYDGQRKTATFYFWPGDQFKVASQGRVKDGDNFTNWLTSTQLLLFLYNSDANYIVHGSPLSSTVQEDLDLYSGVPALGSPKNQSLLHWNW